VTQGYREFEFDLPDALLKSIIEAFDEMDSAPLSPEDVEAIPEAQGVYLLLLNDEIVYIGKTDSDAGLRKRLERHAWTIQHRENLDVNEVSFKAVRVYVFTAMDLETQLIRHYRGKSAVSWNNSGFGSNDPGRNRDRTRAKANSFDVLYPIDLDETIELQLEGLTSLAEVIAALKRALPYTLRVENSGENVRLLHDDFTENNLEMQPGSTTTRSIIERVVAALPEGWQATALAGRIVIYRENYDGYPENRVIARS